MLAGATGRRVCRTCGEPYDDPGHNSLATRSACGRCVGIPEETRRVLGIPRRRLDPLRRQVEGSRDGREPQ